MGEQSIEGKSALVYAVKGCAYDNTLPFHYQPAHMVIGKGCGAVCWCLADYPFKFDRYEVTGDLIAAVEAESQARAKAVAAALNAMVGIEWGSLPSGPREPAAGVMYRAIQWKGVADAIGGSSG